MDLVDREIKYRLGNILDEKQPGNPEGIFRIINGRPIHENTGKHGTVGVKKDLKFICDLHLGDIQLPIYNRGDKAHSDSGYVFSYARPNGDSGVGLLNDHWMYDRKIEPEGRIAWLLFKKFKFLRQWYKYIYNKNKYKDRKIKNNLFDKKIAGWAKKYPAHPELADVNNLTIDIIVNALQPRVPFECKTPVLYWRGAASGGFNDYQYRNDHHLKAVERKSIISHFQEHPSDYIDLGFGNIKNCMGLLETTIYADDNHKYLIYLQGNDFGSNVCWIYGRNCVVFRPDWLKCHTAWDAHLEPWKNYVPFDHKNYDDLIEKIQWCENNTDKCRDIINNANKLHNMMYDIKRREEVYTKMYTIIQNNIIL